MSEPTYDQMQGMTFEQLQQHAMGIGQPENPAAPVQPMQQAAAAPPEQAQRPAEEAGETPQEERQEIEAREEAAQPPAADQAEIERQRQGNPAEALRQEREARRQEAERAQRAEAERQRVEAEHKALLDALQDPERVKAHLQKIAPGPAPDFDDDPQGALDHRLAPVLEDLKATKAELAQMKQEAAHQQYMSRMVEKHGPGFHADLQAFDSANPHLSHLDPELRYVAALGLRSKSAAPPDPAADEARIQALAAEKAKELAAQQVAAVLASGKAPKGIATLGSAPQAKQEQNAPDLNAMSYGDMDGKSASELQAMLRSQYGGG